MARIRTIKPEFWADEKLSPMTTIDRLVFLGLICMADDAGRLVDNIKQVDAFVFPMTEDSAKDSLAALAHAGRLKRGITGSGQRVIQIVNWSHQRIDRPNFAGALPAIAGDSPQLPSGAAVESSRARRGKPSDRVVASVWSAARGRCVSCGVECIRHKENKYDSRPNIGEVDHRVPVRDGGDNSLANLQLLCLDCNRKKAGVDASRRNRGLVVDVDTEQSTTNSGTISVPVSTIYDQDQRSVKRLPSSTKPPVDEEALMDFATAWAAYPRKPGDARKPALLQYLARRKEGVSAATLLAGVTGYAAQCVRESREAKYIMRGETFFGPKERYLADFGPVAAPDDPAPEQQIPDPTWPADSGVLIENPEWYRWAQRNGLMAASR